MTPQEAKELAIKKWQYIVEHNGDVAGLAAKHPELSTLKYKCSYCELYYHIKCNGCPINELGQNCIDYFYSIYKRWHHAYISGDEEYSTQCAKEMLEIIKSIEV